MKYIPLLLLILLLAGCTTNYTLINTIHEVEKLDDVYGVNWRKETITETTITIDNLTLYLDDLRALKEKVAASSNETEIAIMFVDARINMLQAQESYMYAASIGKEFFLEEEGTFNCQDRPKIRKVAEKLEESVQFAARATYHFDTLQNNWSWTQQYIGVDENKPSFYSSNSGKLTEQAGVNMKALATVGTELCS